LKQQSNPRISGRQTLTKVGQHRKRFDVLTTRLAIAKQHIDCFSALWDAQGHFNKELFETRDFWFLTTTAHLNCALLHLCIVYDDDPGAINLLRYLTEVRKGWLKEVTEAGLTLPLHADILICGRKPLCSEPDRQRHLILIKTLRKWRHNVVAHLNYGVALSGGGAFRLQNAWTVPDLLQLIREAVTMIDRYAFSRGKDIRYVECFEERSDYALAKEVIVDSIRSASEKYPRSKPA
jgi:hypothetical protein